MDDIVSWGGEVRYDAGMAYGPNRIGAMQRGEIDAIFDEGASAWGNMALELGHEFSLFGRRHAKDDWNR